MLNEGRNIGYMKNKYDAELLWQKYLSGQCTEKEKAIVESWHIGELKQKEASITEEEQELANKRIQAAIQKKIGHQTNASSSRHALRPWAIAASICLAILLGAYYFHKNTPSTSPIAYIDTPPGGNKAVLKLATGQSISLSTDQEGIVIHKNAISYSDGSDLTALTETNTASQYNEMITPRGGQYQVTLADGTKVWLNAASTLRYPASFIGETREVELTGEAYFEVSKGDIPFIVKTQDQTLQVLGTHFNINAYADEKETVTTLVEGRVALSPRHTNAAKQTPIILEPNQQGILPRGEQHIQVLNTNTAPYVAWKSGNFIFNKSSIQSIMRMVSRWYDVQIEYKTNVTQERINGSISRSVPLSEMLNMLELTGLVHFRIEQGASQAERRIIVM